MVTHELDVRAVSSPPAAPLPGRGGSSPEGFTIGFTSDFMTWNGRPWLAVAGEVHYSRLPREEWRTTLLRMKAGGIDIASTYVFWIHHEEIEGVFDWSGVRDLRAFVQCCAEAGLAAVVRIGPFCHGEVRNGGLPDWLYGRALRLRSNDERYLAHVRRLYAAIAHQLEGLYFADGGPVIAVQLENEHMHAGAPWETVPRLAQEWVPGGSDGPVHLRALRGIAQEAGMRPAFWTCTGWGGASMVPGEMLPLYGGYAYCPWNVTPATPEHAPTREYLFRNYRAPGRRDELFDPPYDPSTLPFACCEMGGGMQSWYRYRFTVPPESVEAMAVVKLAGGCSLLGYYMYCGGSNPVGARGFLNEHVVPRISYDFQAPLGEAGQARESYRRLRRVHAFVASFTDELAPTRPVLPPGASDLAPGDTLTVRWAARARDGAGFVFLNNFQDHSLMRDHEGLRLVVQAAHGPAVFPSEGTLTLRAGVSAILPFGLDLGPVHLVSATVQPLARLPVGDDLHVFFFARAGIPAEYVVRRGPSTVRLTPAPFPGEPLLLGAAGGRRVLAHTLDEEASLGFQVTELRGKWRAVVCDADAWEDAGALRVRGASGQVAALAVFPPPAAVPPVAGAEIQAADAVAGGPWARYTLAFPRHPVELAVVMSGTADAEVEIPATAFDGARDIILSVDYDGDVGSAFSGSALVADDFCSGQAWQISLRRRLQSVQDVRLSLHVTPRREQAAAASGAMAAQAGTARETAVIHSVTAAAVLEAVLS